MVSPSKDTECLHEFVMVERLKREKMKYLILNGVSLHAFSQCSRISLARINKDGHRRVKMATDVSLILPVHNAGQWLDECLESIHNQDFVGTLEVSIYNDCSTDGSSSLIDEWCGRFNEKGIAVVVSGSTAEGPRAGGPHAGGPYSGGPHAGGPRGVGFARNCAVRQSNGLFLCFLDADDVMSKERIRKQHDAASRHRNALIGSRFRRTPEQSTERFTRWANALTPRQLLTQVYTSHGPTVIMPTWFCSRQVFDRVGGFDESGKGTPEDLIFFYSHLSCGGAVIRLDDSLLTYRYHQQCETFSVPETAIWDLRMRAVQDCVLARWSSFTIWSAGKQGRRFYRSLSSVNRSKVTAFCDVDVKKISKGFYTYEETKQLPKPKVPIVHFSKAKCPIIVCVKQDLTGGSFEENLASLKLVEGVDYFHFG